MATLNYNLIDGRSTSSHLTNVRRFTARSLQVIAWMTLAVLLFDSLVDPHAVLVSHLLVP